MDKKVFFEKLADALEANEDNINEAFELDSEILNSVALLDIIAVIDEEFGVTVPTKELKECTSVGAIVELVRGQGVPL
jgi:acyl carrier protein